jgi:spermidine synthase
MAIVDTELMLSLTNGVFAETACSSDTTSIYPLRECYWAGTTPTCQVVIAESPVYGKVLFLDKEIQSSEFDEAIYHEHLVHPIMAATSHIPNRRVLIVGGGEGATCREVLKWDVSRVDWVDIDGPLVDLCRRHLSWADDAVYNDPRVTYYPQDIRVFLANTDAHYDVIILDLPDPDVDALQMDDSLLYGRQFWTSVCDKGDAIVSHVGPVSPSRRPGLDWITKLSNATGHTTGHAYHTYIPSFQGEWGFWMSCPPRNIDVWPGKMDSASQQYAFTWPNHWNM